MNSRSLELYIIQLYRVETIIFTNNNLSTFTYRALHHQIQSIHQRPSTTLKHLPVDRFFSFFSSALT